MSNFLTKHAHNCCIDLDDLLQEARLVFLQHLRKIKDETDIMLCKYDILGALSELCRRMALIKIPKYCYGDVIRNIQRVSYDDAIREYEERFAQEVDLPLDIKAFEETLTEQERIACRMKQHGYSSREIIPFVGVKGDTQMSRIMKELRGKALVFFAV